MTYLWIVRIYDVVQRPIISKRRAREKLVGVHRPSRAMGSL